MNTKNLSFYSMVFLALALMGLIIITQLFTNRSTQALNMGNIQTVEIFKINNRMQTLVNLSFDLQSKLRNPASLADHSRLEQLSDSVTILGYNTSILHKAITGLEYGSYANKIDSLVKTLVNESIQILVATRADNFAKADSLAERLRDSKLDDKIYTSCLEVQKVLEKNIDENLKKNTTQAGMLSTYNRVLAVVAVIAILILATIIIKHQSDQLKLIEDLKAAEATALKSKNAKDEFVANMSHELRTPLNALIGFSNLLHQTKMNKQQQEYVEVIRSGGYNLLNIVNDVLDLSKIEAGKLKIVKRPFNLAKVLENLEKMFSAAVAEKNLSYQWHIDEKIPLNLEGDSERLKQILINLIGNSIKFTNTGSIQLNAGIVWADEESNSYKLGFTVKDTGAGIPKDKIQAVFERFEQLEPVTTRQHGGTGLGLTIVRNLVEKMGGAISVYSEVGVGSEFSFTCVFDKENTQTSNATETDDLIIADLSNIRILAAEDNRANQTLLKHLLAKYEVQLMIVENGQQVLDILTKQSFDLILMDIQMPVMDGYTAVGIIKEDLGITTPVVAMTAYVSEDEIQKCINAGFDDYMPKPIEEKVLIKVITGRTNVSPKAADYTSYGGDLNYLRELVGDEPEAISEIVGEMKEQWSLDKSELKSALQENNILEIKRILHRIKSTFSPLGPEHDIYKEILGINTRFVNENDKINYEKFEHLMVKVDKFTDSLNPVISVKEAHDGEKPAIL